MEPEIERLYRERAQCCALIANLAMRLGYPVGVADDPEESGWPVLLIRLPTGQVSWHYSEDDAKKYLDHVPRRANDWDGHNTEEKYRRVEAMQRYYLWVKPEGRNGSEDK